jgi:hypothetical protein
MFTSQYLLAANKHEKLRTYFGKCPNQSAGRFVLEISKQLEKNSSYYELKKHIENNGLHSKNYISHYEIKHDPTTQMTSVSVDCPLPLMKVSIYKDNGIESYNAILADNGELLDPTYEHLLRNEKKLNNQLAALALPVKDIEKSYPKVIANLFSPLDSDLRSEMSEIILDDEKKMTIILSIKNRPVTVFLGDTNWEERLLKLTKIVNYSKKSSKLPKIVNLTNDKKIVVKFAE